MENFINGRALHNTLRCNISTQTSSLKKFMYLFYSSVYLFYLLYQGMVASGLVLFLQTWCIHKGGPVFVAVFQPVQTLLVVIIAALTLGDQLFLGG